MEKSKEKQYGVAVTGSLISIILLAMAYKQGITELSGMIGGIIGAFFGIAGIISFFSPTVSNVLFQLMNNIFYNQKEKINQEQNNPLNSPQVGVVHGNQHINYAPLKKEESVVTYNKDKIEKRLKEIKIKLNRLKKMDREQGRSIFSPLKKEVIGIIHRVYSDNPAEAEKRLIHKIFWMISKDTPESAYQEWYLEGVEGLIDTVNLIIREMDLE